MKIIPGSKPRPGDKRWYLVACDRNGVPWIVAIGPISMPVFVPSHISARFGVAWYIYDEPEKRPDWNHIRRVTYAPNKLSKSDQ